LISFSVKGQNSAESYFNEAAKMYVVNNSKAALEIVNDGLNKYPSDKKLNELKKKLEEKKDNKNKDKKDDKKDGNKDKKDNKDGKDKDKKDDKGDKDKGKNDNKPGNQGQPKPMPGGISKQRTENLLDAVNNEEKKIQDKVNAQKVKGKPVQTEKDW
jgi:hypothetical protein